LGPDNSQTPKKFLAASNSEAWDGIKAHFIALTGVVKKICRQKKVLSSSTTFWLKPLLPWQGDQIGRICAYWAYVYYGQFFDNYRSSANFWAFFHGTNYTSILAKIGWATFWAILSRTHLVTLSPSFISFKSVHTHLWCGHIKITSKKFNHEPLSVAQTFICRLYYIDRFLENPIS
jgi:hypothetical protein